MNLATKETTVGDLRRLNMTLPQAADLLKVDVRHVRKAVDRHVITATIVMKGKQRTRRVSGVEILYLRFGEIFEKTVCRELFAQLTQAPDRQKLSQALVLRHPEGRPNGRLNMETFIYDTAVKTVSDILSLGSAPTLVDDKGRICGANVLAHRIAALVSGGMSVEEVAEDYPNLSHAQINAAVHYAATNPKPGRPFPTRTVKSVLRGGGGGGLAAAFAAARDNEDSV